MSEFPVHLCTSTAFRGAGNLDCRCQTVEPRVRRVVGGTVLGDRQSMPWMVALLNVEAQLVGGATIINDRWVSLYLFVIILLWVNNVTLIVCRFLLTAAHVCNGSKPEELTVIAGTNHIREGSPQPHSPQLVSYKTSLIYSLSEGRDNLHDREPYTMTLDLRLI